jgi:hypothetical protein
MSAEGKGQLTQAVLIEKIIDKEMSDAELLQMTGQGGESA